MIQAAFAEQLLTRIVGDASQYFATLEKAAAATAAFGVGVAAAVGAISVKAFSNFDHAMTESTALVNLTEKEISDLRAEALRLGAVTKAGPETLAKGYYELFSAGLSAKDAIAALTPVARFAAAGAFDLVKATSLSFGALSALGLKVGDTATQMSNLTRITDNLVRASTLVTGSVEEFGRALTRDAGAVMKTYNIALEEGVAVLTAYHEQQIRGQLAGNTFGRMTRLLASAAVKNAKAFKEMDVAVFDAQGRFRNFADIIGDFERATKGMGAEELTKFLNQLGLKTLQQKSLTPLIGMSEKIREWQKALEGAGGTTQQVADRQMRGFANQLKVIKNALEVVKIELGEQLAPAVKFVADAFGFLIGKWREFPQLKQSIFQLFQTIGSIGQRTFAALAQLAGVAWKTITGQEASWSGAVAGFRDILIRVQYFLLQVEVAGIKAFNAIARGIESVSPFVDLLAAQIQTVKTLLEQTYESLSVVTGILPQVLKGKKGDQIKVPELPSFEDFRKKQMEELDKLLKEAEKSAKEAEKALASPASPGKLSGLIDPFAAVGTEQGKARNEALAAELGRFDAAAFGSAEALSRIAEFRARMSAGMKLAPGQGGKADADDELEDLATEQLTVLKQIRDKRGVELSPAGLA